MSEPTKEQLEQAGQRLMGAFIACVSGRASMSDWQMLHTALFGAPFQIVVGQPPAEEKTDGTDKSTGP